MKNVCVILLAGGSGTRMQSAVPKQYMLLHKKPIALHSFDVFLGLPQVCEIVVVCDASYRSLFHSPYTSIPITFADSGDQRQDSVYSGFQAITTRPDLICTHDSARPLISGTLVKNVFDAAEEHGAATIGIPLKFTIKECDTEHFVIRTPDRSLYWEIQTPQVIKTELFQKGFQLLKEKNLTVTDDVSLVELLHQPVKIVEGSSQNIKITTPEDYKLMTQLLDKKSSRQKDKNTQ